MRKLTKEEIENVKENPMFDTLPEKLKDPKCFKKIETKLSNIMISDHKHKSVQTFVRCKRCLAKMNKKNEAIKELGFKDSIQYQHWKKVMQILRAKKDFVLHEPK